MERDIHFLRCHKIVDYSLLVGVQTKENLDEYKKEGRATSQKWKTNNKTRKTSESRRLSAKERKTFWSSLVKQIDLGSSANTESQAETLRMDSRLSNMSALVELLGEGSPMDSPIRSSHNGSVKVLKKFMTPKKDSNKHTGSTNLSSSSTPTDSFQLHPPPTSSSIDSIDSPRDSHLHPLRSVGGLISRVFKPSSKVYPNNQRTNESNISEAAQYYSPNLSDSVGSNMIISDKTIKDLEQIKEAEDNAFSFESWQDCFQSLENRDNNKRTLPDEVNAIHIIDGIDNRLCLILLTQISVTFVLLGRYFFGIIDIFTQYGLRQRIAQFLKDIRYCATKCSSIQFIRLI